MVIPVSAPAVGGIISAVGGILGLFKKKPKVMTPAQSIMSTAQGVTEAGAAYGLNRLTLLNASNATAGAGIDMGGGGPPPLASAMSILGDFVENNYGQDAKDRREHNRLQNELLTLEVDKARTLNAVAEPGSWTTGGALSGGRVGGRISGPATGYLNEDDRGDAYADERDNTVSFQSHGQQSVVPVGPDIDEVMTGAAIEANNKRKARLKFRESPNMEWGAPLAIPPGFVNRTWELMPPSSAKPKPKPKRKSPNYDSSWIQ